MSWHTFDLQKLPEVKHRTYEKQDVELDGTSWQDCMFHECRLIYRGGPCRMVKCYISPNCAWQFEDAASYVLQFLQEVGWQLVPPSHWEQSKPPQ